MYCKRDRRCTCLGAVNRILGDTPIFSDVWQGKDLQQGKFVCVAGKGLTGSFFVCVAAKGVNREGAEWLVAVRILRTE